MERMPTTSPPPRRARLVHVESVQRLTPGMIRIAFTGDDLHDFAADQFTDHYVKLQIPPPGASYAPPFDLDDLKARLPRGEWPRVRTYTVRAWEPDRRRLTIDFVVHGDRGVAGPWAAAARPGDPLMLLGPGGGYAPDPTARRHLMVGDASVIPAIAASLTRVPAGVPVDVLVQVDGPEEEQPLSSPGELRLTWVRDEAALLDALRALELPADGDGAVQAFVHGEAGAVREIRRHLLADRGLPRTALSVSGYWKRTLDDEGWRAVKRAWNEAVEQDVAGV